MASGINFTGLASGVDTSSIVTQLMALEQAPVTRMTNQIDVENARKSTLQDISTKLLSLRTAADALRNVPFWAGSPHGIERRRLLVHARRLVRRARRRATRCRSSGSRPARSGRPRRDGRACATSVPPTPALNVFAAKTTKLTDLTDAAGTSLGLAVGQTISLSGLQGGSPVTSATAYTVTATSTLDDLKTWVQGQVPGSTVTIETRRPDPRQEPGRHRPGADVAGLLDGGRGGRFRHRVRLLGGHRRGRDRHRQGARRTTSSTSPPAA